MFLALFVFVLHALAHINVCFKKLNMNSNGTESSKHKQTSSYQKSLKEPVKYQKGFDEFLPLFLNAFIKIPAFVRLHWRIFQIFLSHDAPFCVIAVRFHIIHEGLEPMHSIKH